MSLVFLALALFLPFTASEASAGPAATAAPVVVEAFKASLNPRRFSALGTNPIKPTLPSRYTRPSAVPAPPVSASHGGPRRRSPLPLAAGLAVVGVAAAAGLRKKSDLQHAPAAGVPPADWKSLARNFAVGVGAGVVAAAAVTGLAAGSIVGGIIVGAAGGGRLIADRVSPSPSAVPRSWNPLADLPWHYNPNYPGGSLATWLGSGPTPQSGGGTAAMAGSGASQWSKLHWLSR